ncbi:MAG: alpha-galactosidase [Oscillospiraceae bacterium]|nr:alpha-galactosidase [Oscillospiraceae bacterium]
MPKTCYKNPESKKIYEGYISDLSTFPVSFAYDEKLYRGFDPDVFKQISREVSREGEKEQTVIVMETGGNLQITLLAAYYENYGAYEWTIWFENTGTKNTGVISKIKAADMCFAGDNPVLSGILGDHQNQYRPYEHKLNENSENNVNFKSEIGKPTHIYFPYFNLEHGDGGTLIALGWGGTWEADFSVSGGNTHFTAVSTNNLRTYLKPGESIRTALMAFIRYETRDKDRATNLWRRWYINCSMPRQNAAGESLRPFSTTCISGDTGLPNSDGSISERHFTWKPSLEKMLSENIRPTYRWFDAGWYFDPYKKTVESDWWGTVGTWELDAEKWPGGTFYESTEFSRQNGMKTLVWFEPERVTHIEGLAANYGYKKEWAMSDGGNVISNNIGDPECLKWTAERIISMMDKNGVEMYREDNNCYPTKCWQNADAAQGENRSGITENKAVSAHYKLWDMIIDYCRQNSKDTFVDSCASGGGRNDLESMRRGIPLLRSDSDRTTTSLRLSMTTAFNKWIPFCGALTTEQVGQLDPDGKRDPYIFRASYLPIFNISAQWTQDPATDFDMIRFGINEWNSVKEYLLEDFYVLTDWKPESDKTGWTSYMFYDPEKGGGALLGFRMEECEKSTCEIRLSMLEASKTYELKDADTGLIGRFSGSELGLGYTLSHDKPRSAKLIFIKEV